MFASMRRYRLQPESVSEFTRRVDESFADQIAARPGFVSYELIDCSGGDVFTLSIFAEPAQAEASRALAQRWTEEQLRDIELTRFEAIHGESVVSRAAPGMLVPAHVGDPRKAVSIRLYRQGTGSVEQLMTQVDRDYADHMRAMDGFEASHLLDCDLGELLWISVLDDTDAVDESDRREFAFVQDALAEFRLQRDASIRGEIAVSRASAVLLEPARA